MPPAALKTKWDLLDALAALGIDLSDLDGILDDGYAMAAVQQVVLDVTAKGTVGAAVTEIAVGTSAQKPPQELIVDRPYVMRVLDVRTGWPLFLSIVNDPTVE